MTLTIERRDYPAKPLWELRDVLALHSDGEYLHCTQRIPTDRLPVIATWPVPLTSIVELRLTE